MGVPELLHTGCLCELSDDKPLTEQHMAGCAHGGHRTERHDRVVRLLSSFAKHAGCSRVVIEPRGLRNYGQQRPDLMYKDNNLAGKKKSRVELKETKYESQQLHRVEKATANNNSLHSLCSW